MADLNQFLGGGGAFPDALYDLGNEFLNGGSVRKYDLNLSGLVTATLVNLTNKKGIVQQINLDAYWVAAKIIVDGKVIVDNTISNADAYGAGSAHCLSTFAVGSRYQYLYLVSIPFKTSLKIEVRSFRDATAQSSAYIYHN